MTMNEFEKEIDKFIEEVSMKKGISWDEAFKLLVAKGLFKKEEQNENIK